MKPGSGGVTRCRWPAMVAAGQQPLNPDAFKAIVAAAPEQCPHGDCSPGGCRAHVRDILRCVWSTRRERERMKFVREAERKPRE